MNLWFRMAYFFLTWRLRKKVGFFDEVITPFRTWPSDLDLNAHMNNGVYLSIMDIARFDLVFRCGLSKHLSANKWYPVVASQMIRYRSSLAPFQAFAIHSKVLGWDERFFFIEQRFVSKKKTVALAVVKGVFLKKGHKGMIPPQHLIDQVELTEEQPALPPWVQQWADADQSFWQTSSPDSNKSL